MGKYWDWYEVEFERVANRKLSQQRQTEILESLREHVADAESEFTNELRGEDEAERLAVRNLGSPRLIVAAEIENPRFDWLPVWIGMLGLAWIGFFMSLSTAVWSIEAVLPVTFATPVLVFLSSLGRKRPKYWALGGATAVLGLATILVTCFGWIDMNRAGGLGFMPKWHISSVTDNDSRLIKQYQSEKQEIAKIWTAFCSTDLTQAKALIQDGNSYRVPGVAVYRGFERQWVHIKNFSEAKGIWGQNLGALTRGFDDAIHRTSSNLSAMRDPRSSSPKSIWEKNGYGMVGIVILSYLALAGAHLLGRGISAIPNWIGRRRWRLAF